MESLLDVFLKRSASLCLCLAVIAGLDLRLDDASSHRYESGYEATIRSAGKE